MPSPGYGKKSLSLKEKSHSFKSLLRFHLKSVNPAYFRGHEADGGSQFCSFASGSLLGPSSPHGFGGFIASILLSLNLYRSAYLSGFTASSSYALQYLAHRFTALAS